MCAQRIFTYDGLYLRFSEISDFRLIEEDYWKVDVFVEVDEVFLCSYPIQPRFNRSRMRMLIAIEFSEYIVSLLKTLFCTL